MHYIGGSKNMVYKRFSIQLYLRFLLILTNLIVITLILTNENRFFSTLVLSVILIIQLYEIVRFINISNRQLARFLQAIHHSDLTFSNKEESLGESFKELNHEFMNILKEISTAKIEKEAQYQYLKLIIDHIDIGIIAIDNDLNITLFNSSALLIPGIDEFSTYEKLSAKNPDLALIIKHIEPNEKRLFEYKVSNNNITLSIQASKVKVMSNQLKLITFSNIASEMEQKEIESWHKLIRTMAHEIINSVTPISSLTETCLMLLEDEEGQLKPLSTLNENHISSIRTGLKTIDKRSNGLYNFVNDYRKLTKLPTPEKQNINLNSFIENTCVLMHAESSKFGINLIKEPIDHTLNLHIDENLIEQVMINLIKNSIDALASKNKPYIAIRAFALNNYTIIEVEDNGVGIPKEIVDNIFIPFYTTKKSGSGIGLSLSRQIMKLHGGQLTFESEPNSRTIFRLKF